MIPYGKQTITDDDINSVIEVLQSAFLTQGPKVPLFESIVSSYVGVKYSLAVNSATSALHIACLALDLGPKDILWTSPISFVASANCGLYCGSKVDFVDIDPKTYNICPKKLEDKLKHSKNLGTLPKVLVAVHLCGQSCDMKKIYALSKAYGFKIIEDASHAIGGRYFDHKIGSCFYSDISVFSFHPVKIITTGEGGMATTNCEDLYRKMELLRTHGINKNSSMMINDSPGDWYYEQVALGFNYRMTDMQAALGISQMKSLENNLNKRHALADRYNEKLRNLPLILPFQLENTFSGMHLYVIRLKLNKINKTQKDVFSALREHGIGVNIHYIPIHTQPYYQDMGFKEGAFPEAEKYYSEAISIPMFHGLTFEDQDRVIKALEQLLS